MIVQRTLNNTIRATGIGLHSGRKIYLTLRPAPVDTGIIFSRVDLDPVVHIPARTENVGDTTLATTLVKDGHRIATIEHLMAAFSGLGIDNAYVEVSAPEIPIMDGSSHPFVFLIQSAGTVEQDKPKQFIRIKSPVKVAAVAFEDEYAVLKPHKGFRVSHNIVYDNAVIKTQAATVDVSATTFVKQVSRARTFGLMEQVEEAQKRNMMLGASLDNAIGVDDFRVLNSDGLRQGDEFVMHKILDAIGDLYVLGHSIIGEFSGFKSGHKTHHALREAVLAHPEAWELVSMEGAEGGEEKTWPVSDLVPGYA